MAIVGRFYNWLFYRCYCYSKTADFRWSNHWKNASIYVLVLLQLNFFTVLFLLLFSLDFWPKLPFSKESVGVAAVGLILAHTWLLGHKDRYKKIIGKFSGESIEEQRRGDRLFSWYVILSLFAFIAMGIFLAVALANRN